VIIEFLTFKIVNDWWNSKEYKKTTELRKKEAETNVIIINGI